MAAEKEGRGGCGESGEKAIWCPGRNNAGLDQGGSIGNGEKWKDLRDCRKYNTRNQMWGGEEERKEPTMMTRLLTWNTGYTIISLTLLGTTLGRI